MNRDRIPGLAGGWARLDGPAGTQMVDASIEAMDAWMRSGRGANHGGVFAAAHATDECVEAARGKLEGEFVVIPRTAHKSDEPVMLDGTRLEELEQKIGLPVRALDLEGFGRMVCGG